MNTRKYLKQLGEKNKIKRWNKKKRLTKASSNMAIVNKKRSIKSNTNLISYLAPVRKLVI